ncbi:MAG: hypothetical protein KJ000_18620 [Pirellulaceae bacterium]|nr:hypothetical protein [Pirellulaceae bacterium]
MPTHKANHPSRRFWFIAVLAVYFAGQTTFAQTEPAGPAPTAEAPAAAESQPEPQPAARPESADPAPAEPAPAEPAPAEPKPAEPKPAEPAPAEPKPAEPAPAEPKPAEPAPAEPKPAEPPSADPAEEPAAEGPPSFERLGDPEMAKRIGLASDQRDEIAALLAQRTEALAAAASEQARAAVIADSDSKLSAVLTDVQRGDFLGKPVDKRLRFMFRYQQWKDVLQWLADQADMSLVMDAPPPGTFNYSDTREYTPEEAIDMLNGVLTIKGYTLVRRGRMLMLVDLSEGLPDGLVFQVPLTSLDKYGKFEFVTVQFDLGKRSPEAVEAAIKPLLSPYHKLTIVPTTRQLFVTDRAGVMRSVGEVVQALPEPVTPPAAPVETPEKPVVEVYPITKADPDAAMTVLRALVPAGNIVLDPKLNQVNAHATPTQQAIIQRVLEQMEAGVPEESRPNLEVYPIATFLDNAIAGSQLVDTLKNIVPQAQLSVSADLKSLVAWATPADQGAIKTALEKLSVDKSPRASRQLEVHRLFKVDPETTLALFQTILPEARLAVDKETRTLIAVAVPADQEVIRGTLKVLQPTEPGPDTPELRFYELTLAMPPDFPEVIQKVSPNSTVAMDQSGMRLMVIASPAEHAKIDKTIQEMQRTTFVQGRPKLVFYPVTPDQRRRFDSVWPALSKELPRVELVREGQPGELAIWARPRQHEVIAEVMDELLREVPDSEKFELSTYPIATRDLSGVLSMLETLYPETKFVSDSESQRLLVWSTRQQHDSIKRSLEQLQATGTGTATTVEIYPLTKAEPNSTLTLLQSMVPHAKLSLDLRAENLVALAVPEDHQTIAAALGKLQPTDADEQAPRLQFYAFDEPPSANLIDILENLTPRARITADAENKRLAVVASPADHAKIEATLEQFHQAAPSKGKPTLAVYPLRASDPAGVQGILKSLLPDSQLTLDAKTNSLVALAAPADQAVIKTTLEQLQAVAAAPDTPVLRFHPLSQAPADNLVKVIQDLVPQAQITPDAENQRLTVVASPADHDTITNIVAEFEANTPPVERAMLTVYPVTPTQQRRFETALTQLAADLPSVQLLPNTAPGELAIWAKPSDHARVAELLKRLATDAAADTPPRLAAYTLKVADPATVSGVLERLFPDVEIVTDQKTRKVMVWAPLEEQARISEAIEQIDSGEPAAWDQEIRAYPLRDADPAVVVEMLTRSLPDVRLSSDAKAGAILAWGTRQEHEQIKKVVEQLSQAPDSAQKVAVYDLKAITAASAQGILQTAVPQAKLTIDAENPQRLTAWARGFEHESIAAILQEIDVPGDGRQESTVEVYTIPSVSLTGAIYQLRTLSTAFPKAQFSLGGDAGQVVAWATAKDHEQIRALVERMKTPAAEDARKLVVYTLDHIEAEQARDILRKVVESAELTADPANPKRLTVWAKAAEHQAIEDALTQIDVEEAAGSGSTAVIYSLEDMDATAAIYAVQFLTATVPTARITRAAQPNQLLAWANARDHERLQMLVDQLTKQPAVEAAPKVAVYTTTSIPAATALAVLRKVAPRAELTADPTNPQRFTAWARPAEHTAIQTVLSDIDVVEAPELTSQAIVYPLPGMTATSSIYVRSFLANAFPRASFTLGAAPEQVVAWATAAEHQQIKKLVDQLAGTGDPANAPKAALYTLQFADADSVRTLLQTAVPQAKLSVDATQPQRLTAWARPAEHDTIKAILAEVDVEAGAAAGTTVAVYRLQGATLATYMPYATQLLTAAYPKAKFSPGPEPGQLLVWANAKDHQGIAELIDRLNAGPPPDEAPVAAVYSMKNITSASAQTILASAVPRAKLSSDVRDPQRLTAWASPADQATIKAIVEQIDVAGDPETSYSVAIYKLEGMSTRAIYYAGTFLASVVPQARFTPGSEEGQMVVWATAKDHEQIKTLIDELTKSPPADIARQIAVYPLQHITAANASQVLTTALPRATITTTPDDPQRLTAWATPADQKTIQAMLEKIDIATEAGGGPTVAVYSLQGATAATTLPYALRLLTTAFPRAQFSAGIEPGQLLAWATAKDQQGIQELVDRLNAGPPAEEAPVAAVYSLKNITSASAQTILASAVPRAKLSSDARDLQRLTAWASPADQATIMAIVEQIDVAGDPETSYSVAIYKLEGMSTRAIYYAGTFLAGVVPQARFTPGSEEGQMVVWATAKDHEQIKKLIEELTKSPPPEIARQIAVYPLQHITAASASQVLTTALPRATITTTPDDPQRLTAWAIPADQKTIQAMLEKIDIETEVGRGATVAVYRLDGATATTVPNALKLLAAAFSRSQFAAGIEPGQLLAWATVEEHEGIQELIDQLNAAPPPEQAPKAVVYTMKFVNAAQVVELLAGATPEAKTTADAEDPQRLVVWAKPADHATIEGILQQVDVEGAVDSGRSAVIYSLEEMDLRSLVFAFRFLTTSVPDARFSPGAREGQVLAYATAKDHQRIQSLVEQLTAAPPAEQAPAAAVYTLKFITATTASEVLRKAVPKAEFTLDAADTARMTVWASPADQATIKSILEQIDVEGEAGGANVEIYQLEGGLTATSAAYALRLLGTAFPNARFSTGTDPAQVVAWASAKDHAEIKALVDRLNAGPPPEKSPAVVVYKLDFLEAAQAQTVLAAAVPQATLTLDPAAPQRLTAWATPEDHQTIDTVLKQIDVEEAVASDRTVAIYSLRDMNPRSVSYVWRFLAGAVPNARLTPGAEPEQLVAWASAKDHQQLKMLIDQLTTVAPEDEPKIAIYTTKFITGANAVQILQLAVPRATLTPDADDPQRLTAWARASDHGNIKSILQEIDVEGDAEAASTVEVYTLQGGLTATSSVYALRLLGTAFPRARFSMGTDAGQIVAWAPARDHADIRALVERLNAGPPDELAPKAEIYTLEFLPAADAVTLLQRAVPAATLTPDPRDPQRLTAWGTPLEHRSIATILKQLDVEIDPANAPTLQIYTLEGIDTRTSTATLRLLTSAFPEITFTAGAEPGQVLALAGPKQHVEIQKLVDQLNQPQPEELAAKAMVYSLKFITAASALQTLQTALPQVRLTSDRDDPQRLTAWARPADHDKVARILAEIDTEADPASRATPVVYTLEKIDPRLAVYTIRYLATAFPKAVISPGAVQGQLIVVATAKDHEQLKTLVDQINQGPPPELAPTAKVYPLKLATATAAIQALSRAVPEATLSVAPDSNQIVAWARPADHEKIAEILETLDQKAPAELEPTAIVYTVDTADVVEVTRILRYAVPQARITAGAEPQQLVAWARPADHALIEDIIEKMAQKGPEELASKVVVYSVPSGDAASALAFLQSTVPAARFSVGSDPRRLIAWARPADHERIKRAVDEIAAGAAEMTTHVYRFRYADPTAAMTVLATLVPTAKMAVDRNEQTLVVTALPEDHEKVRATVDAMDGEDAEGQRPTLKVHKVEVGDVASLYRSLILLFRTDATVQLSMDSRNNSLIAVATAAKHERIHEMIQALAEAAREDADIVMELYPMRNIDSAAALSILQQMMERQGGRAELSYDYRTNQLIAIAKPEYQQLIRDTLDQLRGEEPLLEIYELQFVDPMSAQMAISRQFSDAGLLGPEVDMDPVTDQLFVRATDEQHEQIRDLLIKMGETKLKLQGSRDGRAMRTIRVQGDVSEALREIQRLWPRLRDNELRVISPEELPATVKPPSPAPVPPATAPPPKSVPDNASLRGEFRQPGEVYFVAQIESDQPSADLMPATKRKSKLKGEPAEPVETPQLPPAPIMPPAADEPPEAPLGPPPDLPAETPSELPADMVNDDASAVRPPVFLVPGEGTITIVSEDPEAVQQLEELLRTILPGSGEIGRNISMYPLKYSSAVDVAERLRELFTATGTTWRRGYQPVSIVPDERLNSILVQGSRIDRDTIEALIRTMDTEDARATKPQIVPIHYAEAEEIATTLREVFRSQMTGRTAASTTSTRTATRSLSRMSAEIAVDDATNSLIVVAASPLLEEIIDLAGVLDRGAEENPARGVKIISLQKANSTRVEQALQRILGTSRPTTTRASR